MIAHELARYWAAKHLTMLDESEGAHLIADAIARAEEAGVKNKANKLMIEILYGKYE